MYAAKYGHFEVVRVLLEWGADKSLQVKASERFVVEFPRVLYSQLLAVSVST